MWKITMGLYFYIAASLVSGDWQPQNYGQNQLRQAFPPLGPPFERPPTYIKQTNSIPQARPCRRRNSEDSGIIITDSGWLQLPLVQPPIVRQTGNQPLQPEQAQSLTESKTVNVEQELKKEEQTVRKTEPSDENVELVDKSSQPNNFFEKPYADDGNRRATPDQKYNDIFLDKLKLDQGSGTALEDRREYSNQPSTDQNNLDEKSIECEESIRNGEEVTDVENKSAPSKINEQTKKLISECIRQSRRSMQGGDDYEGDSRKFEPDNPSSSDIDVKDFDKSQANLLKSVVMPSNSLINKSPQVYLENPANNAGKWNGEKEVSLLENGRVCYACSSYYDPSCWNINATTTVKYCNRDNNACLSKMYKIEGKLIVIRDCGHTCNVNDKYNVGQKMMSCSMCHNDLCNSAYAIHGLNILLVTFVVYTIKFSLQ